ncbi:helix-turn-helix domain-containing protein [Amycolatopsis lurida]
MDSVNAAKAGATRTLAWAKRHLTTRQLLADPELRAELAAELHRKRTKRDARTLAAEYRVSLATVYSLSTEHQARLAQPAPIQPAATRPALRSKAARRTLALRLKKAGSQTGRVAAAEGLSKQAATRLLREFDAELRARCLAPCSVEDLAAEYEVTEAVMRRWLRSAGIGTSGTHESRQQPGRSGSGASTPAPADDHPSRVVVHVGRELRAFRKAAGMTIDEAAAKVNQSPGTVRSWEAAERALSLQRHVRYCGVLGADPVDVLARACAAAREATTTIDLRKLARTKRPELQKLRRFALAQINAGGQPGKPFVLTEQTQAMLADLIDVDVGTLLTLIAEA